MNKIVFITGATSGFGRAMAEKFASNNWSCIITGRRKEKLLEIANELKERYSTEILPLVFDVQKRQDVFEAINNIP